MARTALWRVPLSLFEVKSRIRAPSALSPDFLPRTARPAPLRDARRRSTIKLLYGPGIASPGFARLRDIVHMVGLYNIYTDTLPPRALCIVWLVLWRRRPRARSAPRRISSESRRGSRMRLEGSAGGSVAWRLPDCGSKYPGARARHRPRRGVGYQFVSSVSPSLCSTFFSRVSP